MKILDNLLLDILTQQAKQSARLRMNYNLHDSLDAKVQQLFNALEPGTELPIHRHSYTAETYILVRGSLEVMFYNKDKEIISKDILDIKKGKFGIYIPKNQWHTIKVLETGTVIFEVKDGPYTPLANDDILK